MAAPPVGQAGEACSALLSLAIVCLKTYCCPGPKYRRAVHSTRGFQSQMQVLPGGCVTGQLFNFMLFSHAAGQHNERLHNNQGTGESKGSSWYGISAVIMRETYVISLCPHQATWQHLIGQQNKESVIWKCWYIHTYVGVFRNAKKKNAFIYWGLR